MIKPNDLVSVTESDEPLANVDMAISGSAEVREEKGLSNLPENAVLNVDGSITLRLSWPAALRFKLADQSVREEPIEDELVFHRLKGADLRAMMNAKGDDASLILFTRSTRKGDGRGPLIFDALDAIDARAAMAIVNFLSGAGVKTGR